MIVIFQEENREISATALGGDQILWQEIVKRSALSVWLKQAYDAARLHRRDVLLFVMPETALVRRLLPLSPESTPNMLQRMAVSALLPLLGERPAAMSVRPLAGRGCCAVCGCSKTTLDEQLAPFGRYKRRMRVVGAADMAMAQLETLSDGYYFLQALLWTAVVTVVEGCVVDGRAESGGNVLALSNVLRAAHEESAWLSLPDTLTPLAMIPPQDGVRLQALALSRYQGGENINWRGDKLLLALAICCVLLPLAALVGLSLRPAETQTEVPQEKAVVDSVKRSDYATLLSQAYAAKDDRITLLGHEAGEGSLAITGRCSEPLDLAAYLRGLDDVEPDLHPLLLECVQMTVDDKSHYEFIVQIALEEGEAS